MNTKVTIFSIKNSRWLTAWMRQFCNATMMKAANIRKTKGASATDVMQLLLSIPFCPLSIWQLSGHGRQVPCRDTFYRFLSNTSYNWRRLLASVSLTLIAQLDRLTGPRCDRVLILDESPYRRPRSKTVEYLGKQYDHSTARYFRGFRLLTLGWSDGHSFVPVEMELLTNAEPDKRIGPDPTLDGRTHAGKRSRQAPRKASNVSVEMIRRARTQGLPIDYLVVDSWYTHPGLLDQLSESVPVVCMLKNLPTLLYRHGKRIYNLERLYQKVSGRCRSNPEGPIIGSISVRMLNGPPVRVVFIRDQRDPDKWLALASTDLEISRERICRIYAKRWAIEVFFKQIKQQLGLVGELQVRSYTSCVAHTSIVFLRYMMLAYYQRQQADQKTIPGLFYQACEQLQAMALQGCLQLILLELLVIVSKSMNPQAFQAAWALCGIVEKFVKNLRNNSITFKPLTYTCES